MSWELGGPASLRGPIPPANTRPFSLPADALTVWLCPCLLVCSPPSVFFLLGDLQEQVSPVLLKVQFGFIFSLSLSLFFFFNVYLFLRQREMEYEQGRGREREGDTESEVGSRL